jgi:hypothetical protein
MVVGGWKRGRGRGGGGERGKGEGEEGGEGKGGGGMFPVNSFCNPTETMAASCLG